MPHGPTMPRDSLEPQVERDFMLIPCNTDAPIYHWPYATVGIIAVNVAVFFAAATGHVEDMSSYVLTYGDGLHPLQWITSNFIHGNLEHLASNMAFLWAFGLVIEGKLGWWKFLLVYFGIGIVQCAGEQTLMLGSDLSGSAGASAIIFGLTAMALVWAPENCIHLAYFFMLFFRAFTGIWEVRIVVLAGWYIAIEVVLALVSHEIFFSSVLHVSGAAIGFAVGFAMLKLDWVDCEGWDLISIMSGRKGEGKGRRVREAHQRDPVVVKESVGGSLNEFRSAMNRGSAHDALQEYARLSTRSRVPENELRELIIALHKSGMEVDSLFAMSDYIRRFPAKSTKMRLKAAEILVRKIQRPKQALKILQPIEDEVEGSKLGGAFRQLRKEANAQIENGVMEFETEEW
ncbi:MAG: rhomboid family intramembrane serine protease [Planctomycetota bacterium]